MLYLFDVRISLYSTVGAKFHLNQSRLTYNDQDDDDNVTRFLILAREPIISGTNKPYKVLVTVAQCYIIEIF